MIIQELVFEMQYGMFKMESGIFKFVFEMQCGIQIHILVLSSTISTSMGL